MLLNRALIAIRTIKKPSDFKLVYQKGRRYDGRLMTTFVKINKHGVDRLGITVSRKTSRRAVDRNRMKRLLRETYRLGMNAHDGLNFRYDWVFNGRFGLSRVKLTKSLADFTTIVERIKRDESALLDRLTQP